MRTYTALNEKNKSHIWQYGRKAVLQKPSSENMSELRKEIIGKALRFNIRDIHTYSGYKGDLLVQITASDMLILKALQKQAQILEMETVIKEDHDLMIHALFCIVPDDVYALKIKERGCERA